MSEKLKEEDTKKYKIVARVLGVITRIGTVFCWIGAVAVALVSIGAAIIAPNVKIDNEAKEITLFGNSVSYDIKDKEFEIGEGDNKIVVKDGKVTVGENGTTADIKISDADIKTIEEFVEKDAMKFIAALPYALTLAFVSVLFVALALGHCASTLKNIATEDTPFTQENIERTEKAAKYFLISFVFTFAANFILDLVMDVRGYHFDFSSITAILGLYVAVYVFKYGLSLEGKKKSKED